MADHSMDITVKFDGQELKNSIEQAKKEAGTRYDLKDSDVEIELTDDSIKINVETEGQIEAVFGILIKKVISRNLSPKILQRGKITQGGKMRYNEELKITKILDAENAKNIAKIIREGFPKVKPNIQGDTVRVTSKSIDDLQELIRHLQSLESIEVPLDFGNYR